MAQSARSLGATLSQAAALLVRNPIIFLPGIVVALLGAAARHGLQALLQSVIFVGTNGNANVGYAQLTFASIALTTLSLLLSLVQMAFVVGMAAAAWRTKHASLRDGARELRERWLSILALILALFLIGLVAAPLAPLTFGLTLLLFMLTCIYAIPATALGGRDAVAGIVESASLAFENFGPTLAVVVLIIVVSVIAGFLATLLSAWLPGLGGVFSTLAEQLSVTYAFTVIVGEYLALRHAPTS